MTIFDWRLHNEIIDDIDSFGDPTPFGFVYIITHIPSGKSYIGKKVLFHNKKTKLTKKDLEKYTNIKGRKPKHKIITKESDWKKYWGSNKELLEIVKSEPSKNFKKDILDVAYNKKMLTYLETKYLFKYEVLEKPHKFFNNNILGKFYSKDLATPNK
jgi:hypothetical protein